MLTSLPRRQRSQELAANASREPVAPGIVSGHSPTSRLPVKFGGGTAEQFQAWPRSVKNYLNAQMRGMKGIFEKVRLCFCLVGHTHENIDQFFSR